MTTTRSEQAVRNFIWVDDERVETLDLSSADDRCAILARASGQFALHQVTGAETHVLARDPLGVNKLFFAIEPDGTVASSSYYIDLVRRGFPVTKVWSVPAGHVLTVAPAARELSLHRYTELGFNEQPLWDPADLQTGVALVRARLTRVFRRIASDVRGCSVYVTLSGGLDSTTIAVLVRQLIGEFTAVTFSVDDGSGNRSEDFSYATRVAAELGVPLLPVLATPDEVLSLIDTALVHGQDWRDFNVHCALVNAAIGRSVRALHASSGGSLPPVILTGDVMNELMADYAAVPYHGREYYRLPRLSPERLRRALVMGLDAGDREVGVFAHFGIDVIQPYAMCAAEYLALPSAFVAAPGAKQRLVRDVMGDAIPPYVYERPKARAQTGSARVPGGTLSVLADNGVDQNALAARFAELLGTQLARLSDLIRGGFYRFPSSYPT